MAKKDKKPKLKKIKKRLVHELISAVHAATFTLRTCLPAIKTQFEPSTQVYGEVKDCETALQNILDKISREP